MSWRRWSVRIGSWTAFLLVVTVGSVNATGPHPGCEPYPTDAAYAPTQIKGCEVYGVGTASMWDGPGVARNDCLWPWDACQPIAIRSLDTGIVIQVTPRMYGDLYTGTADERIVDLDPASVAALGLDASRGLWRVEVSPIDQAGEPLRAQTHSPAPLMADTATRERTQP